jgi:hypothetical protein
MMHRQDTNCFCSSSPFFAVWCRKYLDDGNDEKRRREREKEE